MGAELFGTSKFFGWTVTSDPSLFKIAPPYASSESVYFVPADFQAKVVQWWNELRCQTHALQLPVLAPDLTRPFAGEWLDYGPANPFADDHVTNYERWVYRKFGPLYLLNGRMGIQKEALISKGWANDTLKYFRVESSLLAGAPGLTAEAWSSGNKSDAFVSKIVKAVVCLSLSEVGRRLLDYLSALTAAGDRLITIRPWEGGKAEDAQVSHDFRPDVEGYNDAPNLRAWSRGYSLTAPGARKVAKVFFGAALGDLSCVTKDGCPRRPLLCLPMSLHTSLTSLPLAQIVDRRSSQMSKA